MKKFLYGSLALVFAIAAFAFTNPVIENKSMTDVTFYYDPPMGTNYNQGPVTTLSNWKDGSASCNGSNTKACQILVQPSYYHYDDILSKNVLNTTGTFLSINTSGSGSVYYVTSTTGITTITNKN